MDEKILLTLRNTANANTIKWRVSHVKNQARPSNIQAKMAHNSILSPLSRHKIVVAADSFKGSLTSAEVAEAARRGILNIDETLEVACVPVGDGGEGTADALIAAMNGRKRICRAEGPIGREVVATYGILNNNTAVIEMASAAGLTLIPAAERNPLTASTYGVGQMICNALDHGCRHFMLCIGGSATNDAGMGMLQALGYKFYDSDGRTLGRGGKQLLYVDSIDSSQRIPALDNATFSVACDVQNPFYGPDGAAYVFARQKGADDAMIETLDQGLRHFAAVVSEATGIDVQSFPGAGAAGGLGGALVAFLGAKLVPGIEMVLDAIHFDNILQNASLVITGEGKLDRQTLMGKTPYGVMLHAKKLSIPVVAIGGSVEDAEMLNRAGFDCVLPLLPRPATLAEAMDTQFTKSNIARTTGQIIRFWEKCS